MVNITELTLSVYGAWRLAHFERHGMAYFDRTVEGFWRSFQAAVLVAPATALIIALHYLRYPVEAHWLRVLLVEGTAYVIGWVAFPFAMIYIARFLDRESEYFGYIVAYNWSTVVQTLFFIPVATIKIGGLIRPELADLLFVGARIAILVYLWFIARTALRVNGLTAAALVAIDYFILEMVSATAANMLR